MNGKAAKCEASQKTCLWNFIYLSLLSGIKAQMKQRLGSIRTVFIFYLNFSHGLHLKNCLNQFLMRRFTLTILAIAAGIAATAQTVADFESFTLTKADTYYVKTTTPGVDAGFNDGFDF